MQQQRKLKSVAFEPSTRIEWKEKANTEVGYIQKSFVTKNKHLEWHLRNLQKLEKDATIFSLQLYKV